MKPKLLLYAAVTVAITITIYCLYVLFSLYFIFHGDPFSRAAAEKTYESDKQLLFTYAEHLGYEKKNEINLFRKQADGFEAKYDYTTLVFSTNDPAKTFAQKVNTLHLPTEYYFSTEKDIQFLSDMNEFRPYELKVSGYKEEDVFINNADAPHTMSWSLKIDANKTLAIKFAELPHENVKWIDKNETFAEDIVVITLRR